MTPFVSDNRITPNLQEQQLFHVRWHNKYLVDPYYSPALNQDLQRIYEVL
jgi:hypothetical protein